MEDFKVKDISQAEFGRKEILIAESEMPGLMALREEYKFDREHKAREEELIKKFYNNETISEKDIEIQENLDPEVKNDDNEENKNK